MWFYPKVKFKLQFFDRSVIRTNWKKINDRPLRRAGALVRKIARDSIKRDNRKKITRKGRKGEYGRPSRPGNPPFSRAAGHPFKLIYNLPAKGGLQEVVGMVGFGEANPPPGLHEHGGYARRRVFPRNKFSGHTNKPRIMKNVRYPKRPFMLPSLQKSRHRLPEFWRNSISRAGY